MEEKKTEECYVFLDAGYLSKISEYFAGEGNYLKYNLGKFPIALARGKGLWCKNTFYYTAPPYLSSMPTPEERERRSRHNNFVENILKKKYGFIVREGRCQKGEDYHQKGVDSLIDIDLMDLCQKKVVKNIIILTCDTDFVPILNKIRSEWGLRVILAYFTDHKRNSIFSLSNHLLTACDSFILVEKNHFEIIGTKKKFKM